MLVLPHNCQESARFKIWDDKANASLTKRFQNGLSEPDETLNPWTFEPVNAYAFSSLSLRIVPTPLERGTKSLMKHKR
jgi:hypothetical protein